MATRFIMVIISQFIQNVELLCCTAKVSIMHVSYASIKIKYKRFKNKETNLFLLAHVCLFT